MICRNHEPAVRKSMKLKSLYFEPLATLYCGAQELSWRQREADHPEIWSCTSSRRKTNQYCRVGTNSQVSRC